jgi:hypothetical protein
MLPQYRWVGMFGIDEKLRCPVGHPFATQDVWSDEDDLVCDHRASRESAPCGRMLWLIGGAMRLRGKAVVIVCEVSAREMQHLKTSKLDCDSTLRFLGLRTDLKETA